MTTTAFQYIFDKAAEISINKRAIVAQTTTRDQTVRTVSRGGQVWRFEVTPPAGLPWTEARQYIEAIDNADRYTVGQVQINHSGYNSWLTKYQGDSANYTGFVATITQGSNTITLTTSPTTSNGYKFRAGDILQMGTAGHCYTVASDVAYNSNTVTLNRPVIDAGAAGVQLKVGPNVTWNVVCIDIPDWRIIGPNLVSFSGTYKFVEYML